MKSLLRGGVLLLFLAVGAASSSPANSLKIGVAQVDITPPVGMRMSGYFSERLSTGAHDPLWAKAMVLEQGGTRLALVFCDLSGVSLNVSTLARAMASEKTGIPVAHISISATHSHTGPLYDDIRWRVAHEAALATHGEDPHEPIHYPAMLITRLVQVIEKANAALAPARLEAGIAQQEGLSFNRRFHMKNGKVAFNPGQLNPNIVRPAGPIDPDVGLLVARPEKGKAPLGIVTIFAMHLDTIGGTEYSADYPFYLEQTLRRGLEHNVISLFGAAPCGDINHIDVSKKETVKGFPVAERIGTALGKTVLEALPALEEIRRPALAAASRKFIAPLQEVSPEQLATAYEKIKLLNDEGVGFFIKVEALKALDLAARGTTWPLEVQAFRIDHETAIVTLPAEIFVELGLAIKRQSPFKRTMVIALANDRPFYVPTLKAFEEGSYEVTNSRVKPGTGERLVETALHLLNEMKP